MNLSFNTKNHITDIYYTVGTGPESNRKMDICLGNEWWGFTSLTPRHPPIPPSGLSDHSCRCFPTLN